MNNIEVRGLVKEYKNFHLGPVDLNIPKGVIVGFIGENGSGKTTTIKLILNLIKRNEGSIKIFGKELKEDHGILNDVGVVFDELNLHSFLTATEVDKIFDNVFVNWSSEDFFKYLKKLNLDDSKQIKAYSRGMKMKLSIAIALSHQARVLILDEATSGLDPVVRDEILEILMEYIQNEENSIFISSHILSDLQKVSDYIAFIHEGKMVFVEEKDRLLEEYVIAYCDSDRVNSFDSDNIIGRIDTGVNTKLLVKKEFVSDDLVTEKPEIEDFMIFIRKGQKNGKINI